MMVGGILPEIDPWTFGWHNSGMAVDGVAVDAVAADSAADVQPGPLANYKLHYRIEHGMLEIMISA